MTTELATLSRLLSTQLTEIFAEINSTYGRAKELVFKAYNLALQEGYSPEEAKKVILDNVTVCGKTTKYSLLPDECKKVTRPKISTKKIPDLESSNNDTINLNTEHQIIQANEEPETKTEEEDTTEVQEERTLPSNREVIIGTLRAQQEINHYKLITEEERRTADKLRTQLNAYERSPLAEQLKDSNRTIDELRELLKRYENDDVKTAREIEEESRKKNLLDIEKSFMIPFKITKEQVPSLIRDLNHTLNNDFQMFLCQDPNGRFVYWMAGYGRNEPEEMRGYAQRFTSVSRENAS